MEQIDPTIKNQVIEARNNYNADEYTEADVKIALSHETKTPRDFGALLSPAR